MCGRYTLGDQQLSFLSERFGFRYGDFENFDWKPNYNVAPQQQVLVVTNDGERHAEIMLRAWLLGSS